VRLLLVEDEIYILSALEKGLKKDGYAIDCAQSGSEAAELADINDYDLIVLDLNLPDFSGLEVLKQVRAKNPNVRVLIVSANRSIEDRINGLDLGANDYMTKPFDFQELKARIRALLRRDFLSKPNNIIEGDFEIDLSAKKILYKKEELILTLKEYAILNHLIQNKGRIVSSEELFENLWNDEADPFSEVMRVHIYSLRKKLLIASGKSNFISTVKGAGYLFNAE